MEMNQSRRERKKIETKQRIQDVALELFLKQGINETTVEQITEAADVAKGTFYNYFETKEAVIDYYFEQENKNNRELMRPILRKLPDTKSRLEAVMKYWTQFTLDHRYFVRVIMQVSFKDYLSKGDIHRFSFGEFLAEILGWGQEQGEIRKDIDKNDLGIYLHLLIFAPGSWYCAVSEEYPLEEKVAEVIDLFLKGAMV